MSLLLGEGHKIPAQFFCAMNQRTIFELDKIIRVQLDKVRTLDGALFLERLRLAGLRAARNAIKGREGSNTQDSVGTAIDDE